VHLIDRKDTLLLLFSFEQRNSSVNDAGDTRPRQMPRRPPRFSHPAAAVVVEIYLREKAAGTMSRNPAMTHRRLPARTGEREMEREWSYRVPTRASTCLMSSRNGCALSLVFSLLWLSCLRELLLSRDQVGQQRLSGAALLLASPLLSSPLSSPLLSSPLLMPNENTARVHHRFHHPWKNPRTWEGEGRGGEGLNHRICALCTGLLAGIIA